MVDRVLIILVLVVVISLVEHQQDLIQEQQLPSVVAVAEVATQVELHLDRVDQHLVLTLTQLEKPVELDLHKVVMDLLLWVVAVVLVLLEVMVVLVVLVLVVTEYKIIS
tara:strand:- start:180 stop:506 length:327 start_codon:yes stop_codon:yes gene_type:complete